MPDLLKRVSSCSFDRMSRCSGWLRSPVEENRSWDVPELVVGDRVVVDFHNSYFGVVLVFVHPLGVYYCFRMCI